jgi:hypothetical protein
VEDTYLVKAQR